MQYAASPRTKKRTASGPRASTNRRNRLISPPIACTGRFRSPMGSATAGDAHAAMPGMERTIASNAGAWASTLRRGNASGTARVIENVLSSAGWPGRPVRGAGSRSDKKPHHTRTFFPDPPRIETCGMNVGRRIEPARRGLLSLRDPSGPTYRSVPSHADGPPNLSA